MSQSKDIKTYESACELVATTFTKKYFGKSVETWWVGDSVGDVFYVNDFYLNVDQMVDYLKYKYTQDQMFDYYYKSLEHYDKEKTLSGFPNIKNFLKIKK